MFNHPFWSKPSNVRKLILGAILAVVAVYGLPVLQVGVKDSLTPGEKNRIDAENNARDVLVKAIGGGLLFATAWVGFLNYKSSQEKNLAERFQQYVGMLSSQEEFTCLAGIHGLEEIAKTNRDYFRRIIWVLQSYFRYSSPFVIHSWTKEEESMLERVWKTYKFPTDEDIMRQAKEENRIDIVLALKNQSVTPTEALMILYDTKKESRERAVRRTVRMLGSKTQVAFTALVSLRQLDLWESDLFLNLSHTNLEFINTVNVDLKGTFFVGCNLEGAVFSGSNLQDTCFNGSELHSASFINADLQNADFTDVRALHRKDFEEAKSCKGAKIPKYLYDQFTKEERAKLGVVCASKLVEQ